MKKGIIIFSGFNERGIIAFLRTIIKINSKHKKIQFGIIAVSTTDPILSTSYKEYVTSIRTNKNLLLEDIINSIKITKDKLKIDKCLIAPSTEALNRFLLNWRQEFIKIGCEIPLVKKTLYEKISDKLSFYLLCKKHKILVPEKIEPGIETIPFVAKPKNYLSSTNIVYYPILIKNKKDYKNFINNFNYNDFFYQRYITGESFYLLYYFFKDKDLIKLSQKNLIQQPGGKSIIAAIPGNFHNEKISTLFENLFISLNFHGLLMVELRREKGKDYMIEANPRFWGPSQLFVDAKPNLFEAFLKDYNFINKVNDTKTNYNVKYFWNGGIIKSNKIVDFHSYDSKKFIREYKEWIKYDVYLQQDTLNLYFKEIKNGF